MAQSYVTGIDRVNANIERQINSIKGRTAEGLWAAIEHLENQMDTVQPLVPIATKFMRDSWYKKIEYKYSGPRIEAGYNAPYAPYVHENLQAVNWTRPGSGPKWLEIHFARERLTMQLIVASYAARGV